MRNAGLILGGVILLVIIGGLLAVAFNRDGLARYVWERARMSTLTLALVKSDAALAMRIGDYHYRSALGVGVPDYDPEFALEAYEKALSIEPGILWGHYQLGRIYFVEGKFEEALNEANAELAANPYNLRVLYLRGLIYAYRENLGDLLRSEEDFSRFTKWAPSEWAGYNDLSWILLKQEKYAEAQEALQAAFVNARGADTNPWLWNMLGVSELNLGNYNEAQRSFEKASQYAAQLTEAGWRSAYPGNDPESAGEGLAAFKTSIAENMAKARAAQTGD